MKYSKGDKVRIRNIDWYEEMLSIPSKLVWQNKLTEDFIGIWCGSHVFRKEMCEFCGRVMTIQEVGIDFYLMEEDGLGYEFTDEMIAGEDVSWMYDGKLVAERFSDGITSSTPKFKIDDRVETNDGLFGYIDEIKYDEANKCYMYYVSFIVDGGYYYENQLKFRVKKDSDSIVPKFKVGDVIVKKDGLTNGYLVASVGSDYYCLSFSNGAGVLAVKDQDEWELLSDSNVEKYEFMKSEIVEKPKPSLIDFMDMLNNEVSLPDGYEFRDGDGNLIAVDKIVLAKKRAKYPNTYEECCKVLGYDDRETYCVCHTGANERLFESLYRLKVCRDAYWKIAGEEMGLCKPWELSIGTSFYYIYYNRTLNTIKKDYADDIHGNLILAFPTEEMRDAFYEAFKDLIEECKEFL
jgi:hypothetical protein